MGAELANKGALQAQLAASGKSRRARQISRRKGREERGESLFGKVPDRDNQVSIQPYPNPEEQDIPGWWAKDKSPGELQPIPSAGIDFGPGRGTRTGKPPIKGRDDYASERERGMMGIGDYERRQFQRRRREKDEAGIGGGPGVPPMFPDPTGQRPDKVSLLEEFMREYSQKQGNPIRM